jgi:hypothetical protein
MTDLSSLLLKGATETRAAKVEGFEPGWLERLAMRMEHAATLPEPARELAVKAVTHSLVDGGPSEEAVCPSFWQVVGYYQRQSKRSR